MSSGSGANGSFEGHPALIEQTGGKVDIYYGPNGPLGPGHGHVVTNPDGGVQYWRQPGSGAPIMDDRTGRQ